MTIREVSEKCGVTADTLRYYEKAGLIPPIKRKENGIRDYTEQDLRWVELSKCMRASGLSIEAIVEYVRLFREGDETIPARLELLLRQRKTLLEKRQKIDDALMWLDKKIDRYENAVATGVLRWNQE